MSTPPLQPKAHVVGSTAILDGIKPMITQEKNDLFRNMADVAAQAENQGVLQDPRVLTQFPLMHMIRLVATMRHMDMLLRELAAESRAVTLDPAADSERLQALAARAVDLVGAPIPVGFSLNAALLAGFDTSKPEQ